MAALGAALREFGRHSGRAAALFERVRGRLQFVAGSAEHSRVSREAIRSKADPAWTGIPLGSGDDWLLFVEGERREWANHPQFLEATQDLLRLTRAMTEARRVQAIQRADRLAYVLGRRLANETDAIRSYQLAVRALTRAADAELGAVAVFCPGENVLKITATHGYPAAVVEHLRIRPGEGVLGRVFATGRPFMTISGRHEGTLNRRPRYRTGSCIVLPARFGGATIGVVSVADPRSADAFGREDLLALRRVLMPAVFAFDRIRASRELAAVARDARVDPVTGLANRQYLQRRLEAEIERAQRLRQPLAMMLLDVDDFKKVNDTWGHVEGDLLLREIAQLLAENVRIFDVCTRYGGEEFAVVMPGATEQIVRQVAERVRRSVQDAFNGALGGPRVTLSAGGALMQAGDTAEHLFRRADAALLAAKQQGKNVVRFAEP